MAEENINEALGLHLFPEDEGANVFAVLDGASVPGLLERLEEHQPAHFCLYRGELAPDMAEVAPYLVQLDPDSEFTYWVVGEGWGKHWGIFAHSYADLRTLRRHFRTFLVVHDAEGNPLYFRYYDPRVLRRYLPTCNADDLAVVFGSVVEAYLLEDEDPRTLLSFRARSGALRRERKPLAPEAEQLDRVV